ncbi:MAG TPA: hypothetical protein VH206_07710 [Xanthobacteraceae bacterium]|jgi:hypothetical protein|nr:hypothetical protein [Xanthobacteraceae bacterium]
MLRIRIVSAGVVLMAAALFAGNPATAETNILAGLRPPAELTGAHAKAHATKHAKATDEKVATRTKVARHKHHTIVAAKTELPAEPTPIAPAADAPPVAAAADTVATPPPANDALQMNAIVVGGQTVPIASPDEVNAMDLAADSGKTTKTVTATPDTASAPTLIAQANAAPAVRTAYAAPISKDQARSSQVGSATWIAEVLAALGGAVTAGVVAWFLIGPGPQRMYG